MNLWSFRRNQFFRSVSDEGEFLAFLIRLQTADRRKLILSLPKAIEIRIATRRVTRFDTSLIFLSAFSFFFQSSKFLRNRKKGKLQKFLQLSTLHCFYRHTTKYYGNDSVFPFFYGFPSLLFHLIPIVSIFLSLSCLLCRRGQIPWKLLVIVQIAH